ncbi:hypothetical protein TVAG_495090 [Trichomonas vaginalis G3]|uniref:Uncharacterized protein n=1 Tax=Trichomonas vaginalis (strain ATCC PRA-98 / G3) TaxID=412133 RepID=A2FWP4_TRIV3|nr:hypothetical protein TVAGG3_0250760 [Trichomonas vaginalis G3]EAX90672.1 hypothetical protein TVAG_495090 [Trichomonas vaginalis G3]KAI5553988.1 hypothetical protein TVAGG3_0250760 [Trichomonas vaginalis G3]|eukprot:XP_001303602.1 hypothetical protein [Trichomonas vaginalis G3]
MDQVITGLKANKVKAQEIIDKANANHAKMIAAIPDETKEQVESIKVQNRNTLKELQDSLDKKNKKKEEGLKKDTSKQISKLQKNQEKHMEEIVETLYKKVVTV